MTSMALFEKGKTLLLLYLMLMCIYDRIMSSLPPLSIVFKAAREHWACLQYESLLLCLRYSPTNAQFRPFETWEQCMTIHL